MAEPSLPFVLITFISGEAMAKKSKLTKEQEKKLAQLILDELVQSYRKLANHKACDWTCLCKLTRMVFGSSSCCQDCPALRKDGTCWGPGGHWRSLLLLWRHDISLAGKAGRTFWRHALKIRGMTVTQARAHARKKANAWKKWALKRI